MQEVTLVSYYIIWKFKLKLKNNKTVTYFLIVYINEANYYLIVTVIFLLFANQRLSIGYNYNVIFLQKIL